MARTQLQWQPCALVCVLIACSGCAALTSSITEDFAADLAAALLEHDDPETVREAMPAYLLLLDSRLVDNPDDADLLLTSSRLYGNFASVFVNEPERRRVLSLRAKKLGWRGFCLRNTDVCDIWERPFEDFEAMINGLDGDDREALFLTASAWATWIQANRDDWSAVADKARVEAMMRRLVELDPGYGAGAPHAYLGVLATLLPEALGGRPEDGRQHFETAIELSGGRNLMFKVLLAENYARLVFDRALHDRLCTEVADADATAPGLTLSNTIAIRQARRLLADSEDYFGE